MKKKVFAGLTALLALCLLLTGCKSDAGTTAAGALPAVEDSLPLFGCPREEVLEKLDLKEGDFDESDAMPGYIFSNKTVSLYGCDFTTTLIFDAGEGSETAGQLYGLNLHLVAEDPDSKETEALEKLRDELNAAYGDPDTDPTSISSLTECWEQVISPTDAMFDNYESYGDWWDTDGSAYGDFSLRDHMRVMLGVDFVRQSDGKGLMTVTVSWQPDPAVFSPAP